MIGRAAVKPWPMTARHAPRLAISFVVAEDEMIVQYGNYDADGEVRERCLFQQFSGYEKFHFFANSLACVKGVYELVCISNQLIFLLSL